MKTGRLIVLLVLALSLAIIIIQNRGPVQPRFLLFTVEMPHILLLLITACAGFILGVLTSLWTGYKKEKQAKLNQSKGAV